jgi:short-subunit dehydrogenase
MHIKGKRVVVTGASSGLGEAIAWNLARQGARLTIASRRFGALQKVAAEIAAGVAMANAPLPIRCDVASRADVHRLISTAVGHMGGIDILINNAASCVYGNTERTSETDFQMLMAVNFHGAVHAMMESLPYMKRQEEGSIVNIASLAALHGVPYLAAYGASKAALVSVSQSLRAELSDCGIQVLVVYPGYIDTPLFNNEKQVGGARRPEGPYPSARSVARSVVRAIRTEKQELVLTTEGKAMAALRGVLPGSVQSAMNRIAGRLRKDEVISHA